MKTEVVVRQSVRDFIATLAPAPRRMVRGALRELETGRADVKALQGDYADYWRLRAGSYRIIFRYRMHEGRRQAICFFAATRDEVYERLADELAGRKGLA